MASVAEILAMLKANKTRQHNHEGASRRFHGAPEKPSKHRRTECGKKIGFCPHCTLVQGDLHIGGECRRCGELITKDTVTKSVNEAAHTAWMRHDKWGNQDIPAPVEIFDWKKAHMHDERFVPQYEGAN